MPELHCSTLPCKFQAWALTDSGCRFGRAALSSAQSGEFVEDNFGFPATLGIDSKPTGSRYLSQFLGLY